MRIKQFVDALLEDEDTWGLSQNDDEKEEVDPIDVKINDVEEAARIASEFASEWIDIKKSEYTELDEYEKIKHIKKKYDKFILQYGLGSKAYLKKNKEEIVDEIHNQIEKDHFQQQKEEDEE